MKNLLAGMLLLASTSTFALVDQMREGVYFDTPSQIITISVDEIQDASFIRDTNDGGVFRYNGCDGDNPTAMIGESTYKIDTYEYYDDFKDHHVIHLTQIETGMIVKIYKHDKRIFLKWNLSNSSEQKRKIIQTK